MIVNVPRSADDTLDCGKAIGDPKIKTCPHGRPTLIEMNYRELKKKFGRTR
jgi:DNA mismatch repair ATPase MutL